MLAAVAVGQCEGGSVLYLDTEGSVDPRRLAQICLARQPGVSKAFIDSQVDRVHLIRVRDAHQLGERISSLESFMIEHDVKLVIVDSIASCVRKENWSIMQRQHILVKQAAHLKWLSDQFVVPIVLTNQVTTKVNSEDPEVDGSSMFNAANCRTAETATGSILPALGNTWSHSVTTRLMLKPGGVLQIHKCPGAAKLHIQYKISAAGLVEQEVEQI